MNAIELAKRRYENSSTPPTPFEEYIQPIYDQAIELGATPEDARELQDLAVEVGLLYMAIELGHAVRSLEAKRDTDQTESSALKLRDYEPDEYLVFRDNGPTFEHYELRRDALVRKIISVGESIVDLVTGKITWCFHETMTQLLINSEFAEFFDRASQKESLPTDAARERRDFYVRRLPWHPEHGAALERNRLARAKRRDSR